MDANNKKYTLPLFIYDDNCSLCVRFKESLSHLSSDNIFHMIPLSDKDIFNHFPILSEDNCQKELHLLDKNGDLHTSTNALKFIISAYPQASKFTWLMESKMGTKALDYFYKMSTKYRESLLNKCKTCR